ncbi:hypothetical protein K435DRAFT_857764 [Dendrothele bispora CBS 962.96]|uniref:Mid2 domain-containing protein n=1 Tax=Dendrothele bispora (strain CBS 962.96) TaxID=1314807 RepID=A0A4S8M617_DENBC|nr:hypothetical protein K435DRAFT_857764 [Dendrothele bispora CBS 962.96]
MWSPAQISTLLFLTLLVKLIHPTHAAHNITVSNSDPSIEYSAHDWAFDTFKKANFTEHFSENDGAKATFTFTAFRFANTYHINDHDPLKGVAIYYSVHLYPNFSDTTAGAHLSVDNDPGDDVQLFDPNSRHYGTTPVVVWGQTGLTNTTHSFSTQILRNVFYITLQELIVTVLDPGDLSEIATLTSTLQSSGTTAAGTNSDLPSKSSKKTNIEIVVGATVAGVFAIGFLVGCLLLYRRRLLRRPDATLSNSQIAPFPHKDGNGGSSSNFDTDEIGNQEIVPILRPKHSVGHKPLDSFSSQDTSGGYHFLPEVHAPSPKPSPSPLVLNLANDERTTRLLQLSMRDPSKDMYSPIIANLANNPHIEMYPGGLASSNQPEVQSKIFGGISVTRDIGRPPPVRSVRNSQLTTIASPPPGYVLEGTANVIVTGNRRGLID